MLTNGNSVLGPLSFTHTHAKSYHTCKGGQQCLAIEMHVDAPSFLGLGTRDSQLGRGASVAGSKLIRKKE